MNLEYSEGHYDVVGLDSIHYQKAGEGVVLIHGMPTWSYLWRNIIPIIAEDYAVYAPDLLGFGLSAKPVGRDTSIVAQAEMLVHFMDHMGLERANIVGHDVGGGVAQMMAIYDKDRVKRLVLVDSVCYDSWPIPEFKALQDAKPSPQQLPSDWVLSTLQRVLARGFCHRKGIDKIIQTYVAPFTGPEGIAAFLRDVEALDSKYTSASAPLLKEFRGPALVLWGEKDPFQKLDYAYRLKADLPHSFITVIPQASHFVMEDDPKQVGWAIREFLNTTSEEGAPLTGSPSEEPPHEG